MHPTTPLLVRSPFARGALAALALLVSFPGAATTIDFEDLGANLPIANPDTGALEPFYNGASAEAVGAPTDFTSAVATFNNEFADFGGGCCWQGWAYSQVSDATTPGLANQYAAIAGSGAGGSATYGVAYTGGAVGAQGPISRIVFAEEVSLVGAMLTNTTYTALSIRDGDGFAEKFGGESGDDPDWFVLTITGRDANGAATGSVDFALADYRFADAALDYIVTDWTWVDFTGLGAVTALEFELDSSDQSFGFLNTPSYFALDDLVFVPEPGTAGLLALGLAALSASARRARAASRRRAKIGKASARPQASRSERSERRPAGERAASRRRARIGRSRTATPVAIAAALIAARAGAGPYTEPGHAPESMQAWATEVEEFARGPVDIARPELGLATFGMPEWTLGPPVDEFDVFSLGDGGSITLWFETGIGDGEGDDFAVYENGFFAPGGVFVELAFVEVSSNGVDFARFDATSLRALPVDGGEAVDPTDYHQLAGKHPLLSGTGFDLAALAGHPLVTAGLLDLRDVAWVRLVDVIGDGSTQDHTGAPLYDPYETAYPSGGFDAEAVGVIHAPEPRAAAMLGAGGPLVAWLARRRRVGACSGNR